MTLKLNSYVKLIFLAGAGCLMVVLFVLSNQFRGQVISQFREDAQRKTEIISRAVREPLVLYDYQEVRRQVGLLLEDNTIDEILIHNSFGEVVTGEMESQPLLENQIKTNVDIFNDQFDKSEHLGKVTVIHSLKSLNYVFSDYFVRIVFVVGSALLIIFGGMIYFVTTLNKFFTSLKVGFEAVLKGEAIYIKDLKSVYEFRRLIEFFNLAARKFNQMQEIEKDLSVKNATTQLAWQVAHDIRSPLTALNMVVRVSAEKLPEEERRLVQSAVQRISDIANNLLNQHKNSISSVNPKSQNRERSENFQTTSDLPREERHLIPNLVEDILSEKRMQYRSLLDVSIESHMGTGSYAAFAKVSSNEIKRVISNLVNNSVEALLNRKGRVRVSVFSEGNGENSKSDRSKLPNEIKIVVEDDGKGIPPEILEKLNEVGGSYGKEGGLGLGLSHAREVMKSFGGGLQIDSNSRMGTKVTLTLPSSEIPAWFTQRLLVSEDMTIAVLDDDVSIHHIWDGRFNEERLRNLKIKIVHFSNGKEFEMWTKKMDKGKKYICLVDYELLGEVATGLDLILNFGLVNHAVLVTSRFEEKNIRLCCEKHGIPLIPKSMASLVPITIDQNNYIREENHHAFEATYDAILLDDDDLVHRTWEMRAREAGKKIRIYKDADSFFSDAPQLGSSTPIYVDVNLGDGEKGDRVAKRIFDSGFKNIYLATGFERESFSDLAFLKGVIGKHPDF